MIWEAFQRRSLKKKKTTKTVYLHIGISKTGSTAIQKYLHKNSDSLKAVGVHYVASGRKGDGESHHQLARLYKNDIDATTEIASVISEIDRSDCQSFILSSELFEYLKLNQIRRLSRDLGSYRIVVVVYLRRQDEALFSMYKELVKKHACATSFSGYFDETQRKGLLLFSKMLSRWERVLGRENVRARVFSRKCLVGGSVIPDILDLVEIKGSAPPYPSKPANPAISAVAVEILRDINANMHYVVDHASNYGLACKLANRLDALVREKFPYLDHDNSCLFSSASEREKVFGYYLRDNKRLSKRYFGGGGILLGSDDSTTGFGLPTDVRREILMGLAEDLKISKIAGSESSEELMILIAGFWSEKLRSICEGSVTH